MCWHGGPLNGDEPAIWNTKDSWGRVLGLQDQVAEWSGLEVEHARNDTLHSASVK